MRNQKVIGRSLVALAWLAAVCDGSNAASNAPAGIVTV